MTLSRKEIMSITNKETAFQEIGMKTEWDNHRKAAERSSWRKKHEPSMIKKCPNRGRRHQSTITKAVKTNSRMPVVQEDDPLCFHCLQSSEGYDLPCAHPICHPCFIQFFRQYDGHIVCNICKKEYDFEDNLVE